ncbi:MAG TPA: GNAT family N-acetyltransferase [Longimicrobiaceae bacterium]|nr:GNAT family N-acetyltransferase [Longimicrobiaceae bacterium]
MSGPTMQTADATSTRPGLTLRTGTAADAAALAELGARTFVETYAADNRPEDMAAFMSAVFGAEQQAAELADPASLFVLAEMGGRPAGYALLRWSPPLDCVPGPSPVYLARLYVAREWIGAGVGPALLHASMREAADRGGRTLWLAVWTRNPRAIAFYRKHGLEIVGEDTFQLGRDLQIDHVMSRPIGPAPAGHHGTPERDG